MRFSRQLGSARCGCFLCWYFINGPVLCVSTLIPTVVASAAEAEYATLFINGKLAISLRQTLTDMNCLQGPTKMITDNATAEKIANGSCALKRSKSMDMRYHWLRRCKEFRDFDIVWDAGRSVTQSIADFLVQDCGPSVFASPRSRASRA